MCTRMEPWGTGIIPSGSRTGDNGLVCLLPFSTASIAPARPADRAALLPGIDPVDIPDLPDGKIVSESLAIGGVTLISDRWRKIERIEIVRLNDRGRPPVRNRSSAMPTRVHGPDARARQARAGAARADRRRGRLGARRRVSAPRRGATGLRARRALRDHARSMSELSRVHYRLVRLRKRGQEVRGTCPGVLGR